MKGKLEQPESTQMRKVNHVRYLAESIGPACLTMTLFQQAAFEHQQHPQYDFSSECDV